MLQIFTLLGALGMFLYGMNVMSSGLEKAAGSRLRNFLSAMTSNPFKGVLTGLGITSVIQSSSATTVMVVSFVNAGLLTLAQAISVIMGANVGTALLDDPTAAEGFIAIGGLKTLLVGVAMSASLAMCLPISTPPNALAHSTGIINTKQMAVVGLIMGVVGFALAYLMLIFI